MRAANSRSGSGAGPPIPARATRRRRAGAGSMRCIRTTGPGPPMPGRGRSRRAPLRDRVPDAPARRRLAPHGGARRPRHRRGRELARVGRHACRHHRPQGGRGRDRARPPRRRGRQPRQEPVHRQHEPRAAHPALGGDRLFGDAGRGAGGSRPGRAAAGSAQDRIVGAPPARPHQRRPRHLEDRGRPHDGGGRGLRRHGDDRRRGGGDRLADRQEAQPPRPRHSRRGRHHAPGPGQGAPVPRQSPRQRGEVHGGGTITLSARREAVDGATG